MAMFDENIYRQPDLKEFVYGFEYEILTPSRGWVKLRYGIDKIDHSELDQFKTDKLKIAHGIIRIKK